MRANKKQRRQQAVSSSEVADFWWCSARIGDPAGVLHGCRNGMPAFASPLTSAAARPAAVSTQLSTPHFSQLSLSALTGVIINGVHGAMTGAVDPGSPWLLSTWALQSWEGGGRRQPFGNHLPPCNGCCKRHSRLNCSQLHHPPTHLPTHLLG